MPAAAVTAPTAVMAAFLDQPSRFWSASWRVDYYGSLQSETATHEGIAALLHDFGDEHGQVNAYNDTRQIERPI